MNPLHQQVYKEILPTAVYTQLIAYCQNEKKELKLNIEMENTINALFNQLKTYQFNKSTKRAITHLDTLKSEEPDKESKYYKLLRIVETVVQEVGFKERLFGEHILGKILKFQLIMMRQYQDQLDMYNY